MIATKGNVDRKEGYNQVAVWPGIGLEPGNEKKYLEEFMLSLNIDVQYLESIETMPDTHADGTPVPDTGGRIDVFMAIKDEDVATFATVRFELDEDGPIRWLEDVLSKDNYTSAIYPERVKEYATW